MRVAKKIYNRHNKTEGPLSVNRRRDTVIQAYKMLGHPRPEFQEPEKISIERGVLSPGTSGSTTSPNETTTAAIILTEQSQDLESLKVAELKALCKERGIKGYSKLKREGLLEALGSV